MKGKALTQSTPGTPTCSRKDQDYGAVGKGLIIFIFQSKMFLIHPSARVAELADALDLGTFQALSNPFSNPSKS
jgi:hypothetical protein